jgi:hypothetical protein
VQSWWVLSAIPFILQRLGYPLTRHILKVAGCR